MKRIISSLFLLVCTVSWTFAQTESKDESWKKIYRASATKINDLVHTRLDVKFDFSSSYLNGKAWITLHPHFYSTDSLSLDAKGMDIHQVELIKNASGTPLKYDYDGMILRIHLNKAYKSGEDYTVFIDYTAKPNELNVQGSAAITDAKGLYFINPKGDEKDKPTQIWTQGETEANSAWFPTIDKPNQKTTHEISMTVPDKFVTLSNGRLAAQKKNTDGTRTDTWKMELPIAPYLVFMGAGEYSVIKDSYKGKEVAYYVEKEYAPVARRIFGHTPEMMAFYSRITGVEYPWNKYDQIVGRDYVSGAMENTTATLHQESAQQDARELVDGNEWEDVIAHELFHHWFGDLVTTESWSNITVNESFADFSETLWNEYKYGKDAGDATNFQGMEAYLKQGKKDADLVRFHYNDKEDLFDLVTYQKGGRILNMLRNYVGDSAFFKSLNLYLTTNKFKSAEAQNLRLAFEEVTGQDLNWFFNQWYYGAGHPKLNVDYVYDDAAKSVKVIISQTQDGDKVFKIPMAIDIYTGQSKERHQVWVENKADTFTFSYSNHPDLINVDGDKTLLCEKKDNKTLDNFIFQYKNAGKYLDRREAIDFCAKQQEDPKALDLLKTAAHDKYYILREYALGKLDLKKENVKTQLAPVILDLAKSDPKSLVRAKAIEIIGKFRSPEYKDILIKATTDSSYTVSGNALEALLPIDTASAMDIAKKLGKLPSKNKLANVIANMLIKFGDEGSFDVTADNFKNMPVTPAKSRLLPPLSDLLAKIQSPEKFKHGVDLIVEFRDEIPQAYRDQTDAYINENILKVLANKKDAAGQKALGDYVRSKMNAGKKGF